MRTQAYSERIDLALPCPACGELVPWSQYRVDTATTSTVRCMCGKS